MKAATRKHVKSQDVRHHWQAAVTGGNLSRLSDRIIENIADDSNTSQLCWCCGKPGYQERAHIAALSLGGTNSLSNLFLLCGPCHARSPDCSDPSHFFQWLKLEAARCLREQDQFARDLWAEMMSIVGHNVSGDLPERFCALNPHAFKHAIAQTTLHGFEVAQSTIRAAATTAALDAVIESAGSKDVPLGALTGQSSEAEISSAPSLPADRSAALDRMASGRTAAKARGVKFGRTPSMTPEKVAAAKTLLEQPGMTMGGAAEAIGVHRATLYRALQIRGET